MVAYYIKVRAMREAVGASPHGGDLNKWPSRLVDAFVLLQEEHSRVESMKVVRDSRQRQSQQQNPRQIQQRR
jgi:hypothetical protein